MTEKELVVTLAENNEDVDFLLGVLNENAKGNFQFKKLKLRRLIKKEMPIDLLGALMERIDRPEINQYAQIELPILIKQLRAEGHGKMWQYLIITKFHYDFTKENFLMIIDNAKQGNEPFFGLHGFDNDRDLELFYQNEFDELQKVKDESEIGQIKEWFEEAICSLGIYKNRLRNVDLAEFDRLIGSSNIETDLIISIGFLKREDRSHYKSKYVTEEAILDLGKALDGEGIKLALYLAYLEVGLYNEGVKSTLLDTMQRHYLTFRMQLMGTLKIIDDMMFVGKHNDLVIKCDDLQHKIKKMETEHETLLLEANKRFERAQSEKEQSRIEVELANTQIDELKNQLLKDKQATIGFAKMLCDDFTNLKIAVVHQTQLLYAPVIYPDLTFTFFDEVVTTGFENIKVVLIQLWGTYTKEMRKLEKTALEAGCELFILQSKDERQLIMEIAHKIAQRRPS